VAFLLFLFVIGMWVILRRRKKLKKWYVVAPLVALGACAFASTRPGAWAANLIANILTIPASWARSPVVNASSVAAVLGLILIAGVGYDLFRDHKADKFVLVGLAVLPLIFIIASGPIAGGGRTFTEAISNFGSTGFGYLVTG
jgi:hypothetical protein